MSRYINRNQVTVSQEFTVIELAIGMGLGIGVYKAIKKLASNSKQEVKNVKKGKSVESAADRLIKITDRFEKKSCYIKGRVDAQAAFLGNPDGVDGKEIVDHLRSITGPFRKIVAKVEPIYEQFGKLAERYNDGKIEELDFEDENDELISKMYSAVLSGMDSNITINGLKLTKSGTGISDSYHSPSTSKSSIRSPTPSQIEALLKLAGNLLELETRYVKISYPEYAQGDMTWAVSISEMLSDTLNALLEYLDDGIEAIN